MAFDEVGGVMKQTSEATPKDRGGDQLKAVLAEAAEVTTAGADATGWSPSMDAWLLKRRGELGLPWAAIVPICGMGKTRCISRYQLLSSGDGRPAVAKATSAAEAGDLDRDGLDWLQRKGKLTLRQRLAAELYRKAYREAGDLSVKSSLNIVEGGPGAGGGGMAHAAAGTATAKRALFVLRWQVLGGQLDLLTVCDGICGLGHTPRSLAGGDGTDRTKRRQAVLEAVLMVALDLIAKAQDERVKAGVAAAT
jgi:hypothetical protein